MKGFVLNEEYKYIIYGAGGNGYRVIDILRKHGLDVVAVIDKRAEQIQLIENVPVYTLTDIKSKIVTTKKTVVIITIKNVFAHVGIVRNLIQLGFENVIYKTYGVLQGARDIEWNSIDEVYENLVEKKQWLDTFTENIIASSRLNHLFFFRDNLCIEKCGEKVLCYLPIELLKNYDRQDAYGLLPMMGYYPLIDFYQYLLGNSIGITYEEIKQNLCIYAMDWIVRTNQELSDLLVESMVKSRADIFFEMQKSAELDKEFFNRNAPSVRKCENGTFYLESSGRNRVSFLIAKGCRYIPVIMCENDYVEWQNEDNFFKIRNYMEHEGISEFFTYIPSPYMAGFSAQAPDYMNKFCSSIVRKIVRELHKKAWRTIRNGIQVDYESWLKEKKKVCIIVAIYDEGTISRILSSYGFETIRYELLNENCQVIHQLDLLQSCVINTSIPKKYQKKILITDTKALDSINMDFSNIEHIFLLNYGNVVNITGFCEEEVFFRSIWRGENVCGQHFIREVEER